MALKQQIGRGEIQSPESLFREYLNEQANRITEQMRSGQPQDFPAYRELVGELKGMQKAFELWQRAHHGVSIDQPMAKRPTQDWMTS